MIGIYKILSPNGKLYIGQSTNIEYRKHRYSKSHCKRQVLLYNSIQKYGWESHIHELIEECSVGQLNEREIYYTEYYNALSPNGLVLRVGGRSGYWSEEVKNKMSKPRKEGTGNKISKSNKGVPKSQRTKEHSEKLAKSKYKPILQYSLNMEFIKEWDSLLSASSGLNIPKGTIFNILSKRVKQPKNHIFKYKK
jgi:group I intron endonuclease